MCSECDVPMTLKKHTDRRFLCLVRGTGHERIVIDCRKAHSLKARGFFLFKWYICFSANNSYIQTLRLPPSGMLCYVQGKNVWFSFFKKMCFISMEDKFTRRGRLLETGYIRRDCRIGRKKVPLRKHCGGELDFESQWQSLHWRASRDGIQQKDMDLHISEYLWRMDCEICNADSF